MESTGRRRSIGSLSAVRTLAEKAVWAGRHAVGTPARRYALVTLALASLFSGTAIVAARYHAERDALAREHFARGQALADEGRPALASRWFRASLALNRDDTTRKLALATALLQAGRAREAGVHLADVLRADPTSGPANLARARVARALETPDIAELHYQRAIYGEWRAGGAQERLDTRFELIEFLLAHGERERAVSELTAIEAQAGATVDVARRVGALFLQAGAPERAAPELRAVVAAQPDDGEAWTRLAAAEFELERYAATLTAGEKALALTADADTARRMEVAGAVLALDPTGRRLRTAERQRRGRELLRRGLDLLDACLDSGTGPTDELVEPARAAARAFLDTPPRTAAVGAEATLDQAEIVWRLATSRCPAARERDPILTRVMELVTRDEPAS
jgi:Tfp pilus assembly protein PilF